MLLLATAVLVHICARSTWRQSESSCSVRLTKISKTMVDGALWSVGVVRLRRRVIDQEECYAIDCPESSTGIHSWS